MTDMLASLRAERDEAREEVKYLREAMIPAKLIQYTIRLSRSDRALLEALLRATGPLTSEQLCRHVDVVLGRSDEASMESVRIAIYRLRHRLREISVVVQLDWGIGYYLGAEDKARVYANRASNEPDVACNQTPGSA